MTRDMDAVKMSHEEMIDTLKGLVFGTFDRTTAKEREALSMVIEHCEQNHQADVIPILEGATNGDVIKAMFPNVKYYATCVEVKLDYHGQYDTGLLFDRKWWNTPYTLKRED